MTLKREGKPWMVSPLPCPWCGKPPMVFPLDPKKDGNAWATVSCVNLDWDTRAGNFADKHLHGTAHGMHRHARKKLTDDDRAAIAASTGALHVIAKQYDVSSSVVKILRRGAST
jgi:hypothetical protein